MGKLSAYDQIVIKNLKRRREEMNIKLILHEYQSKSDYERN